MGLSDNDMKGIQQDQIPQPSISCRMLDMSDYLLLLITVPSIINDKKVRK